MSNELMPPGFDDAGRGRRRTMDDYQILIDALYDAVIWDRIDLKKSKELWNIAGKWIAIEKIKFMREQLAAQLHGKIVINGQSEMPGERPLA